MIIRQLGGLIEESPRRRKWNHWKRLFSSWHRVWLTQVTLLSPRCFDWVGKWTRVLNKKINSKPRSLKTALFFRKGTSQYSFPGWKWAAVAGFGRSSTYADENLSPDYTCLECCRVFIPHRFNPSRCGTDSASSLRSLVSQQVLPITTACT